MASILFPLILAVNPATLLVYYALTRQPHASNVKMFQELITFTTQMAVC